MNCYISCLKCVYATFDIDFPTVFYNLCVMFQLTMNFALALAWFNFKAKWIIMPAKIPMPAMVVAKKQWRNIHAFSEGQTLIIMVVVRHIFSQCSKLEDLDTISKCEETDGVGEFSSSRERCQGSSSFKFLSHAHASKVFVRNVTQNMWSSIYHGENYVIYQMTFCQNLSSTLFMEW